MRGEKTLETSGVPSEESHPSILAACKISKLGGRCLWLMPEIKQFMFSIQSSYGAFHSIRFNSMLFLSQRHFTVENWTNTSPESENASSGGTQSPVKVINVWIGQKWHCRHVFVIHICYCVCTIQSNKLSRTIYRLSSILFHAVLLCCWQFWQNSWLKNKVLPDFLS